MAKKRILVIMHEDFIPPLDKKESDFDREKVSWITEYDVITTLNKLGHEVKHIGVTDDLSVMRKAIDSFKPHIVFNLLEEFDGDVLMEQNIVSYLELKKVSYTGCNPRGLLICRDKALAKKILSYHRIKTPKFKVFKKKRKINKPKNLSYPLIVKCLTEDASLAIAKASIVNNEEKLIERVKYIHEKIGVDAIVEEFIEGQELFVGVMGNTRLKTLPIWELVFEKAQNPEKELYSNQAKWNEEYRKRKGITTRAANLPNDIEKNVIDTCKKVYKRLGLTGYARIDLRLSKTGIPYIIEANPNPNISKTDEFAASAKNENIEYKELINEVLKLARKWKK